MSGALSDSVAAAANRGPAGTPVVYSGTPPLSVAAALDVACQPATMYLDDRLSKGSRRAMEGALDVVADILTHGQATARTCPWAGLRYEWTAKLPHQLAERGYSRASIQKQLAALRGVLREAWRLGLMDAETFQRATDIRPPRGQGLTPSAGRAITRGELVALFDACRMDVGAAGRRDAAVMAILYGAGLRRAECAALTLADVNIAEGMLTVSGKGGKTRTAYLAEGAVAALQAWLDVRLTVDGDPEHALFLPINRHGGIAVRQMSDKALYLALQKRATAARIPTLSPHDFRRTFVGDLLDSGTDLSTAQQLAGHASPTTTARYDRRGERSKREAAGRLAVPFVTGVTEW